MTTPLTSLFQTEDSWLPVVMARIFNPDCFSLLQ
uniref:Uncharacterized protein n=1 Tax=Arundo donax TaxID=35708 RepID=A0A0A8Z4Z1_ARUDO